MTLLRRVTVTPVHKLPHHLISDVIRLMGIYDQWEYKINGNIKSMRIYRELSLAQRVKVTCREFHRKEKR